MAFVVPVTLLLGLVLRPALRVTLWDGLAFVSTLALAWVVLVGFMTTVPAQALAGEVAPGMLWGGVALAIGLLVAASALFRGGLRRYTSASS